MTVDVGTPFERLRTATEMLRRLGEFVHRPDLNEQIIREIDDQVTTLDLVLADLGERRSGSVVAAQRWPTNAEMIVDMAVLGYLRPEWLTLDPTHGRGIWWQQWRPERLVTHDRKIDGVDFRALPYPDAHFDAVAFDPPYVCVGGRETTTVPDLHERFGLDDAPKTPAGVQQQMHDGLSEIRRVVKPRGIVLVKCQDYVWSGKLWLGTHKLLSHALDLGFECVDRFEHVGDRRPQPETNRDGSPREQQHARRNLSTLFVFRAPKDAGRTAML